MEIPYHRHPFILSYLNGRNIKKNIVRLEIEGNKILPSRKINGKEYGVDGHSYKVSSGTYNQHNMTIYWETIDQKILSGEKDRCFGKTRTQYLITPKTVKPIAPYLVTNLPGCEMMFKITPPVEILTRVN